MEDAPHIGGAIRPQCAADRADLDRVAGELAGRQHGLIARRQLLDLGFSRDMIKRRLTRGALHPVHVGVYALGHPAITFEGRWMAAVRRDVRELGLGFVTELAGKGRDLRSRYGGLESPVVVRVFGLTAGVGVVGFQLLD